MCFIIFHFFPFGSFSISCLNVTLFLAFTLFISLLMVNGMESFLLFTHTAHSLGPKLHPAHSHRLDVVFVDKIYLIIYICNAAGYLWCSFYFLWTKPNKLNDENIMVNRNDARKKIWKGSPGSCCIQSAVHTHTHIPHNDTMQNTAKKQHTHTFMAYSAIFNERNNNNNRNSTTKIDVRIINRQEDDNPSSHITK